MLFRSADPQRAGLAALIAVLVWIRHHENIGRLVRGQESKIKLGKESAISTETAGHNGGPPLDR